MVQNVIVFVSARSANRNQSSSSDKNFTCSRSINLGSVYRDHLFSLSFRLKIRVGDCLNSGKPDKESFNEFCFGGLNGVYFGDPPAKMTVVFLESEEAY